MKKRSLLKTMLLLCALVAGSSSVWATDVEYKTLTFPDDNSANNGLTSSQYESTWTAKSGSFEWDIANFNNNNWANDWTYIKCGRKKGKSANTPSVATITTKTAIDQKIQKVVVSLAAIDKSDYNSIKMYVASENTFTNDLQEIEVTVPLYAEDLTFVVPTPTANMYYKLEFDTKGASSNNGHTVITKVAYCTTSEPNEATAYEKVTETVTIKSDGTQDSDGSCVVTSGNVNTTAKFGYSYGLKLESSSGIITITTPSGSKNAKVEFLFTSQIGNLKLDGSGTNTQIFSSGNGTDGYIATLNIPDSKAGEALTIQKGSGSPVIYRIVLTYEVESATNVFLTTSDNMDGWRSFYDATQDYTLDANTKAYVVRAKSGTQDVVELTELDVTAIPHGAPVILKTSAADHKMVLTKTTGVASLGTNLLDVTDGTHNYDCYRLGYKSGTGVAFYKFTATKPAAGIVYLDPEYINLSATAPDFLTFDFGGTTGINAVNGSEFKVNGEYYNLAGQRVAQPSKGLYIVNGKKVIVK